MEGEKRRRVLYDCDVAIAGSGISGTFAAIAAGRCGARTVLIDRFPMLGGNIGPAMIIAGGLFNEADKSLPGGMSGIPKEFYRRLKAFQSGPEGRYTEESSIASYLLYQMCREAGVTILFSAYASDPIMKGKTVKGIFVECKGGRSAVLAKVVIDGTGDADIARRAGAPIIPYLAIAPGKGIDPRFKTKAIPQGMLRDMSMNREYPQYYNDTDLLCIMANVDRKAYMRFLKRPVRLSAADKKLGRRYFPNLPKALWPAFCAAWRKGPLPEFLPKTKIQVYTSILRPLLDYGGVFGFRVSSRGAIDASDPVLLSRLGGEMRARAFEGAEYLKKNIPGCENAYLLTTSSFLGFRGGPHIDGEHTLTVEEMFAPTRFDDVLYQNIHEMNHGADPSGFDVPYRAVLPRGIDGLLVCGRGAAYQRRGHEPTGMRCRPSMMVLGQTVGTAAAIAALDKVALRKVNIKKVQRRLVRDGIVLGDKRRLKELGLA